MSLVGSLEDLGLTDILQIVSLARKSGRLLLRSGGDAGRIVLCDGLVRAAAIKGEGEDLRGLLVGGGHLGASVFEEASERAGREGLALAEALGQLSELGPERLEALRRQQVEGAIMRMFLWRNGEFSFEVREDVDPEDAELLLARGINTQYLAMEATRLGDEGRSSDADSERDDGLVFSGESDAAEPSDPQPAAYTAAAADAIAMAALRDLEEAQDGEPSGAPEASPAGAAAAEAIAVESAPAGPPVEVAVRVEAPAAAPPIVAMDADLTALEWFKATVAGLAPRVHIFQKADLAVYRIRQYLARGVVPLVVASPRLVEESGDPTLLPRLRSLARGIRVVALVEGGAPARPRPGFDALLERPASLASEPGLWGEHDSQARALRSSVLELSEAPARPGRPATPGFRASLGRLRAVSDRMRDPARGIDVLGLVLDFAAEEFARVAMLVVRDDLVLGMARRGFPDEGSAVDLPPLRTDELPELFATALAERRSVRGALGARRGGLVDWLGGCAPAEAYVAPIESGGCVAALLYADRLPEGSLIGDTAALEIVLHEAGLALDRAVLERALADAEAPA